VTLEASQGAKFDYLLGPRIFLKVKR